MQGHVRRFPRILYHQRKNAQKLQYSILKYSIPYYTLNTFPEHSILLFFSDRLEQMTDEELNDDSVSAASLIDRKICPPWWVPTKPFYGRHVFKAMCVQRVVFSIFLFSDASRGSRRCPTARRRWSTPRWW